MQTKLKTKSLSPKQAAVRYWASVVVFANAFLVLPGAVQYARSGTCQNFLQAGSLPHACRTFEFASYSWQYISAVTACGAVFLALMLLTMRTAAKSAEKQ